MPNKKVKTLTVDGVTYDIKDQKAVTVDTAQTITGIKTITVSGTSTALQIKDTTSTADQVPTATSGRFLEFLDKNGVKEGYLEFYHSADAGSRYIAINVNKDAGATVAEQIAIGINNQNKVFTHAPTPETSSNSKEIATTAYINTKFKYVTALPANPDPNTFYFIKE